MSIPDYQTLMGPIARILSDGEERTARSLRECLAREFALTENELRELVPSGQKPLFDDRVSWATTYMAKAGLVERPRRGAYRLTDRGRSALASSGGRIDNTVLSQFPEFTDFRRRSMEGAAPEAAPTPAAKDTATPEESLGAAYRRLRATIEAELLDQVLAASPAFFERLVVQLLVKMGYGGSLQDAGERVGRSGDGGVDGIIKEDRLGLDVIHIQAKRWTDRQVSRPDVQSFAGSLDGVRARKGVFITTSSFSSEAREYAGRIEKRIVLIDGHELAALMYDNGVGTAPVAAYEVRRVDSDYFDEG